MRVIDDRNSRLKDFAAELASAAYPVMLRGGPTAPWFKLELGLWKAIEETVQEWDQSPPEVDECREWDDLFLEAITGRALAVAERNGVWAPDHEIESGLAQAFEPVIRRNCHVE
jgi:hypothetical protein